jgi:hypothetical protein
MVEVAATVLGLAVMPVAVGLAAASVKRMEERLTATSRGNPLCSTDQENMVGILIKQTWRTKESEEEVGIMEVRTIAEGWQEAAHLDQVGPCPNLDKLDWKGGP